MTDANTTLPPAIVHYLQGPSKESAQFDFLLGEWQTVSKRYAPGAPSVEIRGTWRAERKFDGRMVLDEFIALLSDGRAMSATVTLRTWVPTTNQWEMVVLGAAQPATTVSFTGRRVDGEMHLQIEGLDPTGKPVRGKIRFFNIALTRFDWEQDLSFDNGVTWVRAVSLSAERVVR